MVTPMRMQESAELNRKMENNTCKEDVQKKLIEATKNIAEKDQEEYLSCKISGLEDKPPSEKNCLTPIPFMT